MFRKYDCFWYSLSYIDFVGFLEWNELLEFLPAFDLCFLKIVYVDFITQRVDERQSDVEIKLDKVF